jgi:phospholipid/cholesterol/gamma-HCH transport system substrate-binding protein
MRRGVGARLAASPVMVGAVTVLIAILAVFLAYNANQGLPFVPTYRISATVPNADTLLPGNEVRIGGVRVGVIEDAEPVQDEETGELSAKLDLSLDAEVEPLPEDSTIVVRARSALGLKYLEINRGTSSEGIPAGAIMPASAAKQEPVDIDDVLNTFDEPTRTAIQDNLVEFGNALAGRGPTLNSAIGRLEPLLPRLERVAKTLANPDTRLGRFFSALSDTAAEVAPVAAQQADAIVGLDTTFTALASVSRPFIQETISETPPTLDVGTEVLPRIRPFLSHSAALFTELQPGIDALRANSDAIASSLEIGAPVLARSPELNDQLAPTAAALRRLNDDSKARAGIKRLDQTLTTLRPTLTFLTPSQTVCNYPALLLRNVSDLFSQSSPAGTFQRFTVFDPPKGPNSEGAPASAPANGGEPVPPPPGTDRNYLHYNPYPNTAAPGQTFECEAGNEVFLPAQQVIGNVPGNQGTVTAGQG